MADSSRSLRSSLLVAALALGCAAPARLHAAALAPRQDDGDASKPQARATKIVEVELEKLGREDPAPVSPFASGSRNFHAELQRLRRLADDPDVAAIRLRPGNSLDSARTLDVLKELRSLKSAGKRIVCFAESLDRSSLELASLADLLMLPPSGMIELAAPAAEVLYLKDLLDKLGVRFDVLHVGEFKTAFEEMSRSTMSEAQRTEMTELLREEYEQSVAVIAKNRGIEPAQVERGFDAVLLAPEQARALGLVDAVGYADEFDRKVDDLLGGKTELDDNWDGEKGDELGKVLEQPLAIFSLAKKLLQPADEELPAGAKVAIVYCSGEIDVGKSRASLGGGSLGSDTIVEALEQAREDEDVKAVVLRVNSPGGSALASDLIWRAVQRVREKKPVVASMGDVAASGGYWICMGCDRIVAQPSTITGSIGVVSAMPDLSDALQKIGVKVEVVGFGPHAAELQTLAGGLSPFARERVRAEMERIYADFIDKVARGRKLAPEQVEKNARGRVWTGRAAKEVGLVDALGGLDEAILLACFLGGRLDAAETPLLELPKPPTLLDQLEEAVKQFGVVESGAVELARSAGLEAALPWLRALLGDGRARERTRVLAILPICWRRR